MLEYVGKQFNTSLTGPAHDNMTPAANSCGVAEPKQEYHENGSMEKMLSMPKTKSTNSSVTKTAQIFVAKRTHLRKIKKGDYQSEPPRRLMSRD